MGRRKNILFFMTDQFLWNALGYAGHPVVKTPNLDRLASRSVNFPNAFCASPVCVPARISLFSGQYPHKHGQATNLPVRAGTPMMVDTLNDAGYHTAAMGKLHLMPLRETERFRTLRLHDGYSRKSTSAYAAYLEANAPKYAPMDMHAYPKEGREGVVCGRNIITSKEYEALIFGTSKVPKEYFYTQYLSDEAIRFLETRDESAPFFMFVSFTGPHSPFIVPEPYDTLYSPEDVPIPDSVEEDQSTNPASHRARRSLWGMQHTSVEQLRRITALYYGHITLIDEHIGRVLDKLDHLGLGDDTLIAFSADHGELLGAHGQFYKGCMYDEATRIPLLIHDPERPSPAQSDGLVSQIDIMPTLMDLAGVSVPEWSQGVSLRPLMKGEVPRVRDEVFFEIKHVGDGLGGDCPPGYVVGCRDKDYLFSYELNLRDSSCEGELYDLNADPEQVRNLYAAPEFAGKVREMRELILNWLLATQ